MIVIDEAHNLEHVCDEAASFSITSVEITLAMKELDYISKNSYDAVDPSSFRRVELFLTGLEDSMVAPQLLKTDSGMGKGTSKRFLSRVASYDDCRITWICDIRYIFQP